MLVSKRREGIYSVRVINMLIRGFPLFIPAAHFLSSAPPYKRKNYINTNTW